MKLLNSIRKYNIFVIFLISVALIITLLLINSQQDLRQRANNSDSKAQSGETLIRKNIPTLHYNGFRIKFSYDKETKELKLEDKTTTMAETHKPDSPLSDKDYFNFKVELLQNGTKTYENWVSLRKVNPHAKGPENEFYVDLPYKYGTLRLFSQDGEILFEETISI